MISAGSFTTETEVKYECDICKDTEWIDIKDENGLFISSAPCKCREARIYRRLLDASGITKAFLEKRLDNFKVNSKQSQRSKDAAVMYANNFNSIRKTKNNSMAFLGQVGSGKTHLSIAIANELMSRNIGVRYMQYRESITKIKQLAADEENYTREINKYKSASVLLIDDLYKNATYKNRAGYEVLNDADKRAMFEIINYRYFNNAPIIISSEYLMNNILDFDEGIGSRILEMCKGHVVEINGRENNYRLNA